MVTMLIFFEEGLEKCCLFSLSITYSCLKIFKGPSKPLPPPPSSLSEYASLKYLLLMPAHTMLCCPRIGYGSVPRSEGIVYYLQFMDLTKKVVVFNAD